MLETAAKELEYFGIRAQIRNKRMSRSGFGFALSYMGPLYEGRDITKTGSKGQESSRLQSWR